MTYESVKKRQNFGNKKKIIHESNHQQSNMSIFDII